MSIFRFAICVVPLVSASCASTSAPVVTAEHIEQTDETGIDINPHNGIRDDVDEYIQHTYSDAPIKRRASTVYAESIEAALRSPDVAEKIPEVRTSLEIATVCMVRAFGFQEERAARERLRVELLDTPARMLAYEKLQSRLTGFGDQLNNEVSRSDCQVDLTPYRDTKE
jgi:hypothetical protein